MKNFVQSEKGKILYWIIGIISGIIFAFILFPPLFSTWNKIDPMIFGFPFVIAMSFILMFILAICLLLLYRIQKERGEL